MVAGRRCGVIPGAYQIEHAPPGTAEAVAEVERLSADTQQVTARLARLAGTAPSDDRQDAERWERAMLRHEVGLPVLLTDPEREIIAQADEDSARRVAVMDVLLTELAALTDDPDDETFAAACASGGALPCLDGSARPAATSRRRRPSGHVTRLGPTRSASPARTRT
jgi:hypothetical protein